MNIFDLLSLRLRASEKAVRAFQSPTRGRLEARKRSPGGVEKAPHSGHARTFLMAVTFALLALLAGWSSHGTLWGTLPFTMALLIIRTTTLPFSLPNLAFQQSASPTLANEPFGFASSSSSPKITSPLGLDAREATS